MEEMKNQSSQTPTSDKANTRVLVTGCTGFLGSHTTIQLLAAGYKVRGTVRSLENKSKLKFLDEFLLSHPDLKYNIELVEADLLDATSWEFACKDCQYVMHIASPFPAKEPKIPNDVIQPAVQGTAHVIRAAAACNVKRLVLTSSVSAIVGQSHETREYNERDWGDLETITSSYPKSKILAERTAWRYAGNHANLEVVSINPAFIIGPTLTTSPFTSASLMLKLLNGTIYGLPKIMAQTVDVRDVAAAHIRAIEVPDAKGNRYACVGTNSWAIDVSRVLKAQMEQYGYGVTCRELTYCTVKMVALLDAEVRGVLPFVGTSRTVQNDKIRAGLGVSFRGQEESVRDMAWSLVKMGYLKDRTEGRAGQFEAYPDGQYR
mmetsp:Transcript_43131/g.49574  ORF Transcript_43131/g.49574 Transcript_43131/m.49574 type:complete len:376 (+) Transcript_43131:96-1223(+)